jgi:mono/diheme cytochrome c family protein
MKPTLIAATLVTLAATAHAQAPAGDAARGKALFVKNMCYTCHGSAGQGTRYGTRLGPRTLPWEAFSHQVRHPRAAMPRYPAEYLSEQDLADIVAYLASVKASPKAADIAILGD